MTVEASTPVGANPVTGAIRKAARATGVNFQYLLATAKVESDLNPHLTARSSTATGLFQFIEQTWLATLKQAGPAFGYGHYSDAISVSGSGRYTVDDPTLRAEIMQLRKDPTANAVMGGVFTQHNAAVMASRLGRTPTERELYIGHFFGPYAGSKAIALAASNPNAMAADIFPAAAQANRPIFYDKQGNARTIAGVCEELARRYQVARNQAPPPTGVAMAAAPPRLPLAVSATESSDAPVAIASKRRIRGVAAAAGGLGLFRARRIAAGIQRFRCWRRDVPLAVSDRRATRGDLSRHQRALGRAGKCALTHCVGCGACAHDRVIFLKIHGERFVKPPSVGSAIVGLPPGPAWATTLTGVGRKHDRSSIPAVGTHGAGRRARRCQWRAGTRLSLFEPDTG